MTEEEFKHKFPDGKIFNILGQSYTLVYNKERCDQQDAYGLCECYSKRIYFDTSKWNDENAFEDVYKFYLKVLRHELIHAMFFEMGLSDYCHDETLVDALAIKFPQFEKLLSEIK